MKTIKQFAATTNISEKLIRAVVRQVGGWDSFKELAQDVTNHGAAGGFNGFIYHTDTCAFYAKNRLLIKGLVADMADSLGESGIRMVANFNCLNGDYSQDEVGETLYSNNTKHEAYTVVANALAWFALEEVCRAFDDAQNN